MKNRIFLILLFMSVILLTLTGCRKEESHTYEEVVDFLNSYCINAYPKSEAEYVDDGYYHFKFDLEGKFTLKSAEDNSYIFFHNDYNDLEFTVTSYRAQDGVFGDLGYKLKTDYADKALEYFYAKFVAEKGDEYDFDITNSTSTDCLYNNKEELVKQLQYFLDYLDYLSDADLKLYLYNFYFENPNISDFVIKIGVYNNRLVPYDYESNDYFMSRIPYYYDKRIKESVISESEIIEDSESITEPSENNGFMNTKGKVLAIGDKRLIPSSPVDTAIAGSKEDLDVWYDTIREASDESISYLFVNDMGDTERDLVTDEIISIMQILKNAELEIFTESGNPATGGGYKIIALDSEETPLWYISFDGRWFAVEQNEKTCIFNGENSELNKVTDFIQ